MVIRKVQRYVNKGIMFINPAKAVHILYDIVEFTEQGTKLEVGNFASRTFADKVRVSSVMMSGQAANPRTVTLSSSPLLGLG